MINDVYDMNERGDENCEYKMDITLLTIELKILDWSVKEIIHVTVCSTKWMYLGKSCYSGVLSAHKIKKRMIRPIECGIACREL